MSDLSPRETFEHILHRWWIIAACMILGGAAGWILSLFRTPVFEASAAYEVMLDQQQIIERLHLTPAQVPLDFTTQEVYLRPAEDMFDDLAVRTRFIADAQAQGIPIQYKDINAADYYIDRWGTRWYITVRSTNPTWAAQLANLWVTAVDSALRQAQAHTAQAQFLQLQSNAVQKCFSEMDFIQANQCAGTTFATPEGLDTYLNKIQQQIVSEQQAGRDIDPALSFTLIHPAEPPAYPILYNISLMLLAGSLIGLLAGLLAVQRIPAIKS